MQMNSVNDPIVLSWFKPHLFLVSLIFSQKKFTAIEGSKIVYDKLEKRQLKVYFPSERYKNIFESNRKK